MKQTNRIGEINYNRYKSKMTIIEYNNSDNITVQFDNKFKVETKYCHFKKGNISNPYDKSICNIGYIGEGKYKTKEKGKSVLYYRVWTNMIKRCYDEKIQEKHPTYKDCRIYDEWHNYQNFAKWYESNYYEVKNERIEIDKDILHKGNKIYSPENCLLVPQKINGLFVKSNSKRGDCPIGVSFNKRDNIYAVNCSNGNKHLIHIGTFNSPDIAFKSYKEYKENLIKEIANEYKNKYPQFPQKLYIAMMNYIVEITD